MNKFGAIVLVLAFALCACSAPPERHPILLVGVDGVEWDVVLPLLHEGRLPNLAKLIERGRFGTLASFKPTSSPVIWTSIATGKISSKHGILGFVHEGEERLYTNLDRTTKAIWNILSDAEKRVAVVGWWATFPVEEVQGVMVAQTNTLPDDLEVDTDKFWKGVLYEDLPGQVWPPEMQAKILSVVPEVEAAMPALLREIFGEQPDPSDPVAARLWEACAWSLRADEIYRRVALRLLREEPAFDLFTIYLGGTDVLGHRFWRYLYPGRYTHPPGEAEIRSYGALIPDYYAHVDRVLGELIAAMPDGADVVVVSDHGMSAARKEMKFLPDAPVKSLRSGGHRQAPPGILVAAGPDILGPAAAVEPRELTREKLPEVGSVLDVTPTLLAIMGLSLGRDMDGHVMATVTAAEPSGWVETHTPDGWFEARSREVETPMAGQRLEQLRGLGYLGGGDD